MRIMYSCKPYIIYPCKGKEDMSWLRGSKNIIVTIVKLSPTIHGSGPDSSNVYNYED